jgi:hypothetical protein
VVSYAVLVNGFKLVQHRAVCTWQCLANVVASSQNVQRFWIVAMSFGSSTAESPRSIAHGSFQAYRGTRRSEDNARSRVCNFGFIGLLPKELSC